MRKSLLENVTGQLWGDWSLARLESPAVPGGMQEPGWERIDNSVPPPRPGLAPPSPSLPLSLTRLVPATGSFFPSFPPQGLCTWPSSSLLLPFTHLPHCFSGRGHPPPHPRACQARSTQNSGHFGVRGGGQRGGGLVIVSWDSVRREATWLSSCRVSCSWHALGVHVCSQ